MRVIWENLERENSTHKILKSERGDVKMREKSVWERKTIGREKVKEKSLHERAVREKIKKCKLKEFGENFTQTSARPFSISASTKCKKIQKNIKDIKKCDKQQKCILRRFSF